MERKDVFLTLERVIWNSQVWINGTKVEGFNESLTTPHYFNLSKYLVPGENNKIVIRIDNRRQHDISVKTLHMLIRTIPRLCGMASWENSIDSKDKVQIEELRLTPDIDNQTVNVSVKSEVTVHPQYLVNFCSLSKTLKEISWQIKRYRLTTLK